MVKFLKAAFVVGVILLGITLAVFVRDSRAQPRRATAVRPAASESRCDYTAAVVRMVTDGSRAMDRVAAGGSRDDAVAEVTALMGKLDARPQPGNTAIVRSVAWNVLANERALLRSMARGEQDTHLAGVWLDSLDSLTAEVRKACQ